MRRTRFGLSDAVGFAAVAAGFEILGAGAGAAAGLAGCFFSRLGSGEWLQAGFGRTGKSNFHSKVVPTAHLCGGDDGQGV